MEPRQFESVTSARAWIARQFAGWATRPTAEHLDELRHDKGLGLRAINDALREWNATRFDAPQYLAITEAIAAEALTESVRAYRGIDDSAIVELILLGAAEIPHEAFVSVSLAAEVAKEFAGHHTGAQEPRSVLLAGVLPVGTPAAPLDLIPGGEHTAEAELLLHAGSTFVINELDDEDRDLILAYGHWRQP